jgi:hypothetical protein
VVFELVGPAFTRMALHRTNSTKTGE